MTSMKRKLEQQDDVEGEFGQLASKRIKSEPISTPNTMDVSNLAITITNESLEENNQRFLRELEFVQALSNPQYLHFLATSRLFNDAAFINYLKYLLYWKKPEYAKYLVFPQSLRFLELLQEDNFRRQLLSKEFVELIHRQQFYHWRYYRNNRI